MLTNVSIPHCHNNHAREPVIQKKVVNCICISKGYRVCLNFYEIVNPPLNRGTAVRERSSRGEVDVTVVGHLAVLCHLLCPLAHILHEVLLVLLVAHVNRLLVLGNLANLGTSNNVGDTEVVVVRTLLDGTLNLASEDVLAEARLLAQRTSKTDTINRLQRVGHGANSLETTSNVDLGLCQGRSDQVRELHEEALTLLGALALVAESEVLVGTTAQLDKVELVVLKHLAQLLGLLRVEALVLELDTVQLDTEDEVGRCTLADFVGDFDDQAGAVLEAAAVLVGTLVGGGGEELGEEVTVSTVEFSTVPAALLKVLAGVGKALNDTDDVLLGGSAGLLKGHTHNVTLELNITGGDGVLLNTALDLTTLDNCKHGLSCRRRKVVTYRVRYLTDHEHTMLLSLGSHALEGLKTLTLERSFDRNDRISGGLEVVVLEHDCKGTVSKTSNVDCENTTI